MARGAASDPRPRSTANPLTLAFSRALATAPARAIFWLIAGSYFVCGASTNGLIGTHLIPACVDHGLAEVTGAGLLAATGCLQLSRRNAFRLAQRPRGQPAAARLVLRNCAASPCSICPSPSTCRFYGLSLFSIFYGLDWIAGGPADRSAVEPGGRNRENRDYGSRGSRSSIRSAGASAAYLGGVLRISFGTYLEAFLFAGLLCFAAAADGAVDRGRRAACRARAGRRCGGLTRKCPFGSRRCLVIIVTALALDRGSVAAGCSERPAIVDGKHSRLRVPCHCRHGFGSGLYRAEEKLWHWREPALCRTSRPPC